MMELSKEQRRVIENLNIDTLDTISVSRTRKSREQRAAARKRNRMRIQSAKIAGDIMRILREDNAQERTTLTDELNEDNFATKKPQPAEPKFKVGDKVRIKGCGYEPKLHKGDIGEILDTNDKERCFVLFKKSQAWIYVDCLEPYTKPTANYVRVDYHGADTAASTIADSCQSQPVTDYFDRIVKDDFRDHNRLHIAAMMVPSVIATVLCSENEKGYAKMVATRARILADALISECKKGGENE